MNYLCSLIVFVCINNLVFAESSKFKRKISSDEDYTEYRTRAECEVVNIDDKVVETKIKNN